MDAIREAYSGLTGQLTTEQRTGLQYLEADQQLANFQLSVNGRKAVVPAIRASNWFIELYILNNPENPLILKATLNPLSDGPLDLFTPLGMVKALLGFQVTALDSAGAPSVP